MDDPHSNTASTTPTNGRSSSADGKDTVTATTTSVTTTTTTSTTTTTTTTLPAGLVSQNISLDDVATAVRVLNAVAALQTTSNKKNKNNKKKETNDNKKRNREEQDKQDGNDNQEENMIDEHPSQSQSQSNTSTNDDPLNEYRQCQQLRTFRKALARCFHIHQQTLYNGKSKQEFYQSKLEEQTLKRQKLAESQLQRKHIANTLLRKGRIERLQQKQMEGMEEETFKIQQQQKQQAMQLMIPDGHVETTNNTNSYDNERTKLLLENGSSNDDDGHVKETDTITTENPVRLPKLRSCYVCKARFRQLHHFYDQLCPECATLNWQKRHQTCDLTGKTAVVTGSRVKIGYQTCLKLLRAGCTVVATTRFPNAAADTYRNEPDFDRWKDRLQIFGLDLRDVTGLEAFCRFLKTKLHHCGLDILINNACQTIRRPAAYYLPACEKEQELWQSSDETHQQLLAACREFETIRRRLLLDHKQQQQQQPGEATISNFSPATAAAAAATVPKLTQTHPEILEDGLPPDVTNVAESVKDEDSQLVTTSISSTSAAPFESTGLSHSAASSQMILVPEDVGVSESVLPRGATDINGQQLDLRTTNSWLLKMDEVSTPEVMECMFINAIAPFVLNSRLKSLMCTPSTHADRYIVNVSAMEGKFYRYKMPNHPHTNMAKSALNMMTRTSAEDLAKNHSIYMNSIDTGWINDENPLERASKTAQNNHFQTPIDEIDAAARIVDPIFSQSQDYGKFLKDYRETEW
ncbi:short-chain dehydrogenase [Nitzschia inconspicua]|uniref:Short-chain dehydrogenase n=1 Tax=Nitzschia inconspicua TaxID=303405 RepID=A0A9K3Q483_9STRA|nr:short-chain dehydrogenase [Nitzschia inconspicua]